MPQRGTDERLVLRPTALSAAGSALLLLAMAAGLVWLLASRGSASSFWVNAPLAALALALVVIALFVWSKRGSRGVVVIDESGVRDTASARAWSLPWEEVGEVHVDRPVDDMPPRAFVFTRSQQRLRQGLSAEQGVVAMREAGGHGVIDLYHFRRPQVRFLLDAFRRRGVGVGGDLDRYGS